MSNPKDNLELCQLILELIDGSIEKERLDMLDNWLGQSAEAMEFYREFMKNAVVLKRRASVYLNHEDSHLSPGVLYQLAQCEQMASAIPFSHDKQEEQAPSSRKPTYRRKPISKETSLLFLFKASVMVIIVMSIIMLDRWFWQITSIRPERSVARIVRVAHAEWLVSGQMDVGSQLYPGPIMLKAGFAEIEMSNGARILLEAPVKVDLENASRIYLEKGQLVANIEQFTEERFVVRTANSTVVDYGTEFGVKVDETGQTHAQVFKGEVELRQGSDPLKYDQQMKLQAGQAGMVTRMGDLQAVRAGSQRFITTLPSAYEMAVKKSSPLYYWRFDSDKGGILKNEMESGVNEENRLYGSLGSTQGPDLGARKNTALRLTDYKDDYAILRRCTDQADNAEAFSVAMWIRPEKATKDNNSIMFVKLFTKHDMKPAGFGNRSTIGFTKSNQFTFDVFCPIKLTEKMSDEENVLSTHRIASGPVPSGRWYHIVAAYTNSHQVNLYVNGQLEGTTQISSDIKPVSPEMIWVVDSRKWDKADSALESKVLEDMFMCDIDEISQYNRELSAAEVRMLYEAARGN